MFEQLSSPAYLPFSIAAVVLLLLAFLEIVVLALGITVSEGLDELFADGDARAGFSGHSLLNWLGFGKAPFLVVLVVILAAFSISGIVLQTVASELLGFPVWAPLAVLLALAVTLPAASWLVQRLARLIPSDETSGISRQDLVGQPGVMSQGVATQINTAEAKVTGPKGLSRWVRVRAERGETLSPGTPVRVVGKETDTVFIVRRTAP